MRPYVIGINAVSGGGKTALGKLVHASLPASVLFCFDDFDETNVYPEDYYAWYSRGCNLREFDCPGMRAAFDKECHRGIAQFIVMDYPFGRDHPRFRGQIDLSVFIDTPLDVAMARRILRDHISAADMAPPERLEALKKELDHYLVKARHVYLNTNVHKETSDLILDGWDSLEALRDKILAKIRAEFTNAPRH